MSHYPKLLLGYILNIIIRKMDLHSVIDKITNIQSYHMLDIN